MKQEGLKFFTETNLTILGLMIFFIFFVSVILWVNRKSSQDLYKRANNMPLLEDGE